MLLIPCYSSLPTDSLSTKLSGNDYDSMDLFNFLNARNDISKLYAETMKQQTQIDFIIMNKLFSNGKYLWNCCKYVVEFFFLFRSRKYECK